MKIKVLIDNNTLVDRYFLGEPGVCYYLECEGKKLLFDLGYSDAYLENGNKMGIDFLDLDAIVISHSHLDHTWGMEPLLKRFNETLMEGRTYKRPSLIAHPDIFVPRSFNGMDEFGMNVSADKVFKYMEDNLTIEPIWITENLVFLGQIPRLNDFESKESIGKILIDNNPKDDFSLDDSALCYKSENGLVIITGCSHSGICNIMDYAKKVCGDDRIFDVVGGFHLQNPSDIQLNGTLKYFQESNIKSIHACHCTDLKSKIALSNVVEIAEVGVGLELVY
ncbi:MAG: MBL fold metallo-hydrolase [Bacillota bacterium]|nr:MBL fold metallo-hydrolase [Bacillota bacterium]